MDLLENALSGSKWPIVHDLLSESFSNTVFKLSMIKHTGKSCCPMNMCILFNPLPLLYWKINFKIIHLTWV